MLGAGCRVLWKVEQTWTSRGWEIWFGEKEDKDDRLSSASWADNLWLVCEHLGHLRIMVSELDDEPLSNVAGGRGWCKLRGTIRGRNSI